MKTATLFFLAGLCCQAAPIVNLAIKETAGVARIGEDVTMGVPLPENGGYTDTSAITLRDRNGNLIPCEVTSVSRWHKNPQNIRWLQLNFPFTMAANAADTVTLSLDASPYALPTKLSAVDDGVAVTVNTGKIRFVVRKARFNLLDQVWVDDSGNENYTNANKAVLTHNRGIIHYLSNVEYLSSNDSSSSVMIERQGPGVVTVKAAGQLKNAGGTGTLHFVTRIYAYNNSSHVKIVNTIEFHDPTPSHTVSIQGIHLEIPFSLGTTPRAVIGRPGSHSAANLSGTQDAYCMVARPAGGLTTAGNVLNGTLGGQAPAAAFNPAAAKPRDIGWISLDDGNKGCVMSMHYFWQMAPTSVEAFGDGRMIAAAFSKRSGQNPLPLYGGTGRTSETHWTFFNAASPDTLRSLSMAGTDRLFALASPFWYTRRTLSAVHLPEIKQDLYTPSNWSTVSGWDAKIAAIWEVMLTRDDLHLGLDSYGFLEWGDNPLAAYSLAAPCDVMWNGNYYGLDFFAFEHFYHTGDPRFLRYGIAHARHVEDVHQLHFGDAEPNTGASRYCPPNNHIATDDGNCTPDYGNMSHHKSEGMFLDYYLTGNDHALQCALEAANWSERSGYSYANGPSDNIKTYIRRWAHQMNDLVWAYEYNRAAKYYTRLWQNWEIFRRNIVTPGDTIGQPFMVGLGMEAVTKMYYILSPTYTTNLTTKPDSIAHYLKIWCDSAASIPVGTGSNSINANSTLGYAFLNRFYGPSYLALANQRAATLPAMPSDMHKFFPQQARNLEMAMYYYAIPESVTAYGVGVERGTRDAGPEKPAFDLSASPSPFNPSTVIRISGSVAQGGRRPTVRIYTLNGELVRDLSREIGNRDRAAVFRAESRASNVYIVRCTVGNRTLSKKITLLK